MIEYLSQPWPWYIGGPAIAIIVLLLLTNGRYFGISSSLETICTMAGAGKWVDYFNREWREKSWLLILIVGTILGGAICHFLIPNNAPVQINDQTIADLAGLGIQMDEGLVPADLFNWASLGTIPGILIMLLGGFLIGFGTRYAGGCTSGHAISGLSNLQLPSLVATIGFFIGGLITTYFLLPLILT